MKARTFTTIRTTETPMEALLLIKILDNAGLHPVDLTTFGRFSVAGPDIEYPVRLPTEEVAAARELLSSFNRDAA